MARIIRTQVEVEGRTSEELVIVDGRDLKPWAGRTKVVGHAVPRVDGVDRATGRALYTQDLSFPGMLHLKILRSPHAHARIVSIDTQDAERAPGVHAVMTHENAPVVAWYVESFLFDPRLRYAGEEVAAVAAETPEQANAALARIRVEYEVLPAESHPVRALEDGAPRIGNASNRAGEPAVYERGDQAGVLAAAPDALDVTIETSGALHNALETHGSVARWENGDLTFFDSTQHVFGIRAGLAAKLELPLGKVRVIKTYMGGGFGAKNSVRKYMVIAALLARRTGRPVRAFMDRVEENLCTGHRHETVTRLRMAATPKGKLTAIHAVIHAAAGGHGSGMMPVGGPIRELYACPNVRTEERGAVVNLGPQTAFRAPGYAEGAFVLETAIDMMAHRLGLDPIEFRLRNVPKKDPANGKAYTRPNFAKMLKIARERTAGWAKDGGAGAPRHESVLTGIGTACGIWGVGGGPPAHAVVHVNTDGSLQVITGSQDLGTGTRTVLAQVAAEEFGTDLDRVTVVLGDTGTAPHAPASWGSITVASMAPAVRLAAADARSQVTDLVKQAFGEAAAKKPLNAERFRKLGETLGTFTVTGKGSRFPNPAGKRIVAFAVQSVQVAVDPVTGEVRVERALCVHDCGRVINPRLAMSQVEGGFLQGMGMALMEGRRIDPLTHRMLNPSLLEYKVPTVRDVPRIETVFIEEPDNRANNTGAIGIGEPPVIPAAAAIGNAIFAATGLRLTKIPFTPKSVLDALDAAERSGSAR